METTETTTAAETQPTSEVEGKNTEVETPGTGTQTATEAQPKSFTQADVDRIVQDRLKSAGKSLVKAELKKLLGDEGPASLEELQRQLSDSETRAQVLEAKEAVRDHIANSKKNIRPENQRAIEKLVMQEIRYEDGKPANIEDAIKAVETLAPTLFTTNASSINAGNGRIATTPRDMNSILRHAAGRG